MNPTSKSRQPFVILLVVARRALGDLISFRISARCLDPREIDLLLEYCQVGSCFVLSFESIFLPRGEFIQSSYELQNPTVCAVGPAALPNPSLSQSASLGPPLLLFTSPHVFQSL